MKDPIGYMIIMLAIVAITGLEITAILNGIDGTVYSLSISAITALAGFAVGKLIIK